MTRLRSGPRPFKDTGPFGRFACAVVGRLRVPLRAAGVDTDALRALLQTEFTLGVRRARRAQDEGRQSGLQTGAVLGFVMQVLMGGIGAMAVGFIRDPLWGMGIAQLVLMAMLTMVLVSDYLPMLVDTADVTVIAPLPVGDRTLLATRITHATTLLAVTLLGSSVLPLIAGTIVHGVAFVPIWCLATLLLAGTAVALSFGLFLGAMRLFDMERFRDLILYLQVAAMVLVMGGFQVLPRLVSSAEVESLVRHRGWWLALLPPFHGAGLLAWWQGDHSRLVVVLGVLGVVVPLALLTALVAWLGGGFVARLAAMATGARSAPAPRPRRRVFRDALLRSTAARAGYDFVAALSRRERTFRLRTYPLVAVSVVLGIAMSLQRGAVRNERMLAISLYFLATYSPLVVTMARYSDNHEASWILRTAPLRRPGEFLTGGLTALLVTFTAPAVLLMSGLLLAIAGPEIALDLAFATCVVVGTSVVAMLKLGRRLPFTEQAVKNPMEGSIGLFLAMSFVVILAGATHAALRSLPVAFYLVLGVLPVIVVLLLRRLRGIEPQLAVQRRLRSRRQIADAPDLQ
ncbi:MAG: hypothetical protein IPM29_17485 [Planctomycetes bacterium]|nr:hypothetical protein [Planctomycetota bacterium]